MKPEHEPESRWIVSTTPESFELDVMDRSEVIPVVVDFWAAWCQPCRMLAPELEKLAREYDGQFVLVKANTEEMPQVAAQFGVQSIPAVFGLVDGKVVDFFQGLLPPARIRDWIDSLLRAARLVDARAAEDSDPSRAEQLYREIWQENPSQAPAAIGLARVLLDQGKLDESRQLIDKLAERGFLEPEAEKIKAALQLQPKGVDDLDSCREAVNADPENLTLQLALAEALAGQQQFQEALDICLRLVERDRHGVGDKARQRMIDIFRVLPDESPLTSEYRRRLSTLLY